MYKIRGGKEEWARDQTSMKHPKFPKNFVEILCRSPVPEPWC